VEIPITRGDIVPHVHWVGGDAEYIEILDAVKRPIFQASLPPKKDMEDLHLALFVGKESSKWAKYEGKLWTEYEVSLLHKEGRDIFQLISIVKWNTTTSPYDVLCANGKTDALVSVLNRYYPDENPATTEKWSPQDFYKSVSAPDKNGELSISMRLEALETDLYPFQRRAVQWLLRRECVELSADKVVRARHALDDYTLPISFIEAKDDSGRTCYVSRLFGVVTQDLSPFRKFEESLRGGILAEEMGLGKTVEMISLIALHKRPKESQQEVFDVFSGRNVRPTGATLIITPPSILQQWISEINKHAPHLQVIHYEGIKAKAHSKKEFSELINELAGSDVVISTYSVLAAEIHFTPLNPEKKLRRESKYPRPKSPLVSLSWWRCVIDEAQMIESGVSNAAVVARMIPRINAWCVTGTPVRKDVNDLLGLLIFLRYEPYATSKHVWASLISSQKHDFYKLFGSLALRNNKKSVRDELKLPAQRRYVVTMPFTPIEEQHYQELFSQMCEESGLDTQGGPLEESWNPDTATETMRRWLVRLRQAALHPEIGGRNRRALGHKDGPLRTVDQVLSAMMEQTDLAIRTDQRALLTSKLRRGQCFENSPRVREALAIWEGVVSEASEIVEECREQLRQEIDNVKEDGNSSTLGGRNSTLPGSETENEQEE
jgi:E3 ubiquitin-protein ligase SHPRH